MTDPTAAQKPDAKLDIRSINALRALAIDMVEAANSGHPGLPLGAAPMAHILWHRHLKHNPRNPQWVNRDRFVLSPGHGSALLYALLHASGYGLSVDELRNFRQLGSRTPGHPETFLTPGVEAVTGPLGQGTANAVGMAIAERLLADRFNQPSYDLIDHRTYALVSDGDLMEGISSEACALAGHLGLGKLTFLYDANDVTLDGPASLHMSEDMAGRFSAQGWHVQEVADGDTDLDAIDAAIKAAKADTKRPSLIIVKTTIGYGSPAKAGTAASHGAPLGAAEALATKKALGWDTELPAFQLPQDVAMHLSMPMDTGSDANILWTKMLDGYARKHPKLAAAFATATRGELPTGWDDAIPSFPEGEKIATRAASGKIIASLAAQIPNLVGGDADLSCSTKTEIPGGSNFEGQSGQGRNIRYGVREHAMAAIANGLCYHGGVIPFVSTFFVFSDYMRPATRLACLAQLPVINVWTHDSVGVGEDGPTHQPVEHLAALRAMPNMRVIRPADAVETAEAWRLAIERANGPTGLVLSRQGLPVLAGTLENAAEGVRHGAYIVHQTEVGTTPKLILIATGSEVHLAVEAAQTLAEEHGVAVRVVSMPCWSLFAEQSAAYQEEILPKAIQARIAVEAGTSMGWHRWVGDKGAMVTIDRFGLSAPGPKAMQELGITSQAIVTAAGKLLGLAMQAPADSTEPEPAPIHRDADRKLSPELLPQQ